jgi:hypothetical protein
VVGKERAALGNGSLAGAHEVAVGSDSLDRHVSGAETSYKRDPTQVIRGVAAPAGGGARTIDQLSETLGSVAFQLTDTERHQLTGCSAPGLPPYPYGMIETFCDVDHWHTLGTHGA